MPTVFISHANTDNDIVDHIRKILFLTDIQTLVAEYDERPGEDLWDKIQSMIEKSYYIILLLTFSGNESTWVQREIAMAKALNKKFIPIVEDGVHDSIPDFLKPMEYIPYTAENLLECLERLGFRLRALKNSDLGFSMT